MRVPVFEAHHGDCPYLPDRQWVTYNFSSPAVDERFYEELLGNGWRRSGGIYYQNRCPGCRLCIPIRVSVDEFAPSKSQRRVLRKNEDVAIEIEEHSRDTHARGAESPTLRDADRETYELYCKYTTEWHGAASIPTEAEFAEFLGSSPLQSIVIKYRVGAKLVGTGWLDVLPAGLSSVYFAFDPDAGGRSLGTFSLLREIEHARKLGKRWLYLGFYVPGSRRMQYKANFHPHQILDSGRWRDDRFGVPLNTQSHPAQDAPLGGS